MSKKTRGMVLGKFMPPTLGHLYLTEFAERYVDELVIVVGSLANEPIDGAQRVQWMRELMPRATVVHHTDENPQYPHEHTDFWDIWKRTLSAALDGPVDYVFAGEEYGARLAEVLGAMFVPVPRAEGVVPISATAVRGDPLANWQYLPRCVRAHYARRVCIFGPESTGKSTLAKRLAERFETLFVPEHARSVLEARKSDPTYEDMISFARGQCAAEDALARSANRVLLCDSDPLTTWVWSEALFHRVPVEVERLARARRYDLTLLCDVDVPWVHDAVRYLPNDRRAFFSRCQRALDALDRKYTVLRGSWSAREAAAISAVEGLLTS